MTPARKISILICLHLLSLVHAQDILPPKLKFYALMVEDGLPNNTVNSMVQDSLGFIWIGTNDGLCRYDGKQFKVYREGTDLQQTVSNNFIQSLFIDRQGLLWIMTDQGLNIFDGQNEHFDYLFADGSQGALSHNSVTTMAETEKNDIYVGSYGGGIDQIKDRKVVRNYSTTTPSPLSSNMISSLQIQHDTILWAATYDRGLNRIDLKQNTVSNYAIDDTDPSLSQNMKHLYLDREDFLWISTEAGIIVLNTRNGDYFTINESNCPSFTDDDVLTIFEDQTGLIWIGTRNKGILYANRADLLRRKEKSSFSYHKPTPTDESIYYRSVSSFLQDKDQNIWIGTHLGGVNLVDPEGEKIRYYSSFSKNDNLSSKSVWGICEDDENNIWMGTDGDGVFALNPYTQEISHYQNDPDDPQSLSDNAILCALFDSHGTLWFGTYAGGINTFHRKTGIFKHYRRSLVPTGLNSDDVRVLFEDSQDRIWVGSNGGGLQLFKPDTDSFEFINELGWLDVRAITEDPEGNLWIGTFGNGIVKYDPGTNIATDIPVYDDLNAHIVFSILATSAEDIWIGTRYKGLVHLNPKTMEIKQYREKDGLSNGTIHSIVADKPGKQLWLSTNDGLNMYDIGLNKFVRYDSSSGVQSGPFNNNSGFLSQNGYLVFGGTNGMNVFYPDVIKSEVRPLDIVFTDFKLFNESIPVSNPDQSGILQKSVSFIDEIDLKYNQDVITIDYIALHYPVTKNLQYAYRLDQFDPDWNYVGTTTSATYRNLSPGEYTFRVKVIDEADKWGTRIKSLKIRIHPPLWLTWPALIAYLILGSLLIYFVTRYYIERIKLKNSLFFEQKLRQQESAINQERFRFFTNFSHELRTPLTLILGPINDLLREQEPKLLPKKLNLIQRNAQILLELINKMLEFRKSETDHNHLELSHLNLNQFINGIAENFNYYAEKKEITFEIKENGTHFLWVDHKKLQIILNNLLSNAFKYTPPGGKIGIELSETEEMVSITVRDSGQGIDRDSLASIFNLYYHKDDVDRIDGTGIGLALCKKLMELHEGSIAVESEIGRGTTFTLNFHKGKEFYETLDNIEFIDEEIKFKKPFINDPFYVEQLPDDTITDDNDRVILVVEDNPDVVQYLKEILSKHYKIFSASNGTEGIEKALALVPDIIISDVMMPERSGIELCHILKNTDQTSHIPIVLLTAKVETQDKIEGLQQGADAYISKPFDSEVLQLTLSNLLKSRARIIEYFKASKEEPEDRNENKLDRLFLEKCEKVILEIGCTDDFNTENLAQELGFSRSSLFRKVKAITGLSINQFSRKVRLHRASKLIQQGEMNVSEIAYDLGFNDLKYFRKCFKEEFGVSPSAFKKPVL